MVVRSNKLVIVGVSIVFFLFFFTPNSLCLKVFYLQDIPEFSFKTQTKINYECVSIYCTVSFKKEGVPAMDRLDVMHWRMENGRKHGGLF